MARARWYDVRMATAAATENGADANRSPFGAGAFCIGIEDAQRASVDSLLRAIPGLGTLVDEAVAQIQLRLVGARLTLSELSDPDEPGERLFLGISADGPDSQLMTALRRFDDEWWLANAGRAQGKLCIDLE